MQRRQWFRLGITGALLAAGIPLLVHAVDEADQGNPGLFVAKATEPSSMTELEEPPPPPSLLGGTARGVVGGVVGGVAGGVVGGQVDGQAFKPESPSEGPRMIRTADLTLEVADPLETRKIILGRVAAAKGWVSEQSEERDQDGHAAVKMQLRFPAADFDAAQQGLRDLGKVMEARTQAEDVSRQWVDREARLAVKRAAMARLKQLLAQRTASLKDLLEAEKALVRVTEEIESLEAVHRLQARQVAFATLDLTLQGPRPQVGRAAYSPLARFGERVVSRFGASLAVLGLFLTTLFPWALLAGLVILIRRRWRRATTLPEAP